MLALFASWCRYGGVQGGWRVIQHQSELLKLSMCLQHPLRRVSVCSDAMTRVLWRGCHKLEMLLLACTHLQEAEFLTCQSLCDDMLLTMGDGGKGQPARGQRGIIWACPRLK